MRDVSRENRASRPDPSGAAAPISGGVDWSDVERYGVKVLVFEF